MKRSSIFRCILLFIAAGPFLAVTSHGRPSLNTFAYVTEEDAVRAYDIISRIDYLPFGFKVDGCERRSLFMAMELAVEKIPSSAQFVVGSMAWDHNEPNLWWTHHVAPMLLVGSDPEPVVIDPMVAKTPLKRSEWVKKLRADGSIDGLTFVAVPGTYFKPGSPPLAEDEQVIGSFEELPQFDPKKIGDACRTLRRYLRYEGHADVERKRAKVAQRADELATELALVGKLAVSPGQQPPIDCGDGW